MIDPDDRGELRAVLAVIGVLSLIVLLAAFAVVYMLEPAGGLTPPSPRAAPGSAAGQRAG